MQFNVIYTARPWHKCHAANSFIQRLEVNRQKTAQKKVISLEKVVLINDTSRNAVNAGDCKKRTYICM